MPRKRRLESSTGMYHIMVKGINKEKIFNQNREKSYLKKIILKHLEKYAVEIYGYCIMSNHAHFIIRAEIQTLSFFMAAILAEYASYYNYKHKRNGHVFQNRFNSECIEDSNYYWTCLRYIHLNPVKARMVQKVERYKYSSMVEYINNSDVLICRQAIDKVREEFINNQTFLDYHGELGENIFIDIKEEIEMQKVEVAVKIAKRISDKKQLKVIHRIFEEQPYRLEYMMELQRILKITQKDAKDLCEKVRNLIE